MQVPGVDGASAAYSGLLSSETWRNVITVEGFTPPDGRPLRTFVNAVTPTYFDVMRIAMLRGRRFTDDDREQAARVAIVNDAFARQFFGGGVAIGRRVGLCSSESCGPTATRMMEIVGVAEDAKYSNLRQARRRFCTFPSRRLSGVSAKSRFEPRVTWLRSPRRSTGRSPMSIAGCRLSG